MIRAAVEIARAAPALADASEEQIAELVAGESPVRVLGHHPGGGALAVLRFGAAAEWMLGACDAETADAALEALDRLRAGMVR